MIGRGERAIGAPGRSLVTVPGEREVAGKRQPSATEVRS